ncbi:acyl-CoA dehydrogenase family protein [Saccharopolyspora sp. NPDC050389]|uniref:acyl-CoA dehydrogenase family protein n=1 Tax=Saccharopolyspora sp. NPDC050389 TaxID=3155516 RepID=UPI0033FB44E6
MSENEDLRDEMRKAVADFLRAESDRRAAMDDDHGYDRALFERGVVDLGLGALPVPERFGGLGLGFAEAVVVVEEFGRAVAPSPVPDTLIAATLLGELADAGSLDEAGEALLARLTEEPVAIAVTGLTETPGRGPVVADGGHLSGVVGAVPHGAASDVLLVISGEGDDAAVHLVSPEQPGVTRTPRRALDHTRRLADIELTGARADLLSPEGDDGALARRLVGLARIALAAESAAAAQACLDETVGYLKVREQFGRPIGSFQALKHRCADLAVAVHGAVATAQYAVRFAATGEATDELGDDLPTVAAVAKVVGADTLMRVAAECLQLHGGVGFTYEHDLHLYFKRGKANQLLAGSSPALRRQLAARL